MESNDELKEIDIKNRTRYYFDDIIKIEDLDFDNILSDQKSYENILVANLCVLDSIKCMDLLEFMMGLEI